MRTPVNVIFTEEAERKYQSLKEESTKSKVKRSILRALDNKVELLKNNPFYGRPIAKRLIPKEYKLKNDVKNLYRIELTNFWRMLYTLKNSELKIIALVIEVINHKQYDKKFKYKKN